MAVYEQQMSLADVNPKYQAFVDKFKPKKTTDDCYTPENIFDVVADWAGREYGFTREQIVRPFYPGGDYERFDYPEGCVVCDNPPFSILAAICNFYNAHGQPFFLFAPSLTVPIRDFRNCAIIANANIIYHNGAEVRTAFLTNMDKAYILRTAPDLGRKIEEQNRINRAKDTKELPKYTYPDAVITAATSQRLASAGVEFRVRKDEAMFIPALDAQRKHGKSCFGGALLLSERAAAERAAAERAAAERAAAERAAAERAAATKWELSDREQAWQRGLAYGEQEGRK